MRRVSKVHVHPSYNSSDFRADLAILMLSSPVEFTMYVRPVCLWSPSFTELKVVEGKDGTREVSFGTKPSVPLAGIRSLTAPLRATKYRRESNAFEDHSTDHPYGEVIFMGSLPDRVENHFGQTTFSTLNRDSNLDPPPPPTIGSLVHCECDALDHVANEAGKMSERKATAHYNMPRQTIQNKKKGLHSGKLGGQKAFSNEEEEEFVIGWGYDEFGQVTEELMMATMPIEQVYAMVTVEGAWFSPYVSQTAQISGILGGSSALVFHKKTNGFVTLRPIHVRAQHYSNEPPGRRRVGEVTYTLEQQSVWWRLWNFSQVYGNILGLLPQLQKSKAAPLASYLSHFIARLPMSHSNGRGKRGGKKNEKATNIGSCNWYGMIFSPNYHPPQQSRWEHRLCLHDPASLLLKPLTVQLSPSLVVQVISSNCACPPPVVSMTESQHGREMIALTHQLCLHLAALRGSTQTHHLTTQIVFN
uniref:(California timema) hypothetical protein n=1 Tax=Timema californicum TaxID=61474 RepID=A0A7R9J4C9_TIMCA|nr:unnamed protein product [Timema californicum]